MNHSPVEEYRLNDGKVEARVLDYRSERKTGWREVSPAQLSRHVNTNVARWLERNLGWRRLLRACVGLEPTEICGVLDHQAAYVSVEKQAVS